VLRLVVNFSFCKNNTHFAYLTVSTRSIAIHKAILLFSKKKEKKLSIVPKCKSM
jgi:hypothetical protein